MGHYQPPSNTSNTINTSSVPYNMLSGNFGTGNIQFLHASSSYVIPSSSIRVRLWGAGNVGGGGGFAMKTITGLTVGATVSATVGTTAGASTSFGAYVSATGGGAPSGSTAGVGGAGSSGDFNYSGGSGGAIVGTLYQGYGGAGSLFGPGGDGQLANDPSFIQNKGGSGGGGCADTGGSGGNGGNGFSGQGGAALYSPNGDKGLSQSLDLIGTGGGGAGKNSSAAGNGSNGGGGGSSATTTTGFLSCGGFPGGGGGVPARGLIIVEW